MSPLLRCHLRRRGLGSRPSRTGPVSTIAALVASVCLAAAPVAAAQSTVEADGTIAVSSLGSSSVAPGSLGSLASPAYADYVALGDSYAAFGDQSPSQSTGEPAQCGRNLANYPHILDANPSVGDLTDVSCGGAQVPNLAGPQTLGTPPDTVTAAPQFDALSADTDLVTLSIGGNDVGFGEIVGCLLAHTTPGGPAAPIDCRTALGPTVQTRIAATFGDGGTVDGVYDAIAGAAPGATVIATRYLPLMPDDDEDGCAITSAMGPANLDWAREIARDINDAVDEAATRNGHISVLPTSDIDRSGCASPADRWTDFTGGAPTNSAPFHPTALGQAAMAEAIAAAL